MGCVFFFFQAEDGIRDLVRSRGLGDVYKRQLVEGGGEINSCLLKEGFLDKIMLFYAPILIGGKGAYNLIGGKGIDFLKDAYKINIAAVKRFKEDIYVEGYVHRNY